MQKQDFETYQKRLTFHDFEILPKFSKTHIFLRYHSPPLIVNVGLAFESSHNIVTHVFLQAVQDPQLIMDGDACCVVDR